MIFFPNAKINLGLNIINKRPDGYHNIETIFYPLAIKDALEIVPAQNSRGVFKQVGIPIDVDAQNNLVVRALELIKEHKKIPEFDVYLHKNIPFGAGLGGGSADAAFMLKLVNEFAQLSFSDNELETLASQIGADCPFFIKNMPVFASGIGNIFTPIELDLSQYHFVLVKPEISVSTPNAYSLVEPSPVEISLLDIIKKPIREWGGLMKNDFEKSVFLQYPAIAQIKEGLYILGAKYASMTGSGSSVFAIFEDKICVDGLFSHCKTLYVEPLANNNG
ncbi:4-diphosphocytidyl-2-C-methylerythritol kinase [Bacteroidales bacterium]|nr:4-diphosphocytidyl-2-C-methylerythritol kinase [Bacteroidales bacterium]